jgi:flap endonuclease-1
MGVKSLNRFIIANCPEAIRQLSFSELKNMKIVVDTSIYMYRYSAENALIEKMYQMIILFKYYNIIPVFVFDGKPPTEKKELLQIRKDEKITAENKFHILKKQLATITDVDEIKEIQLEMDSLKKKFVRLTYSDIENVKKLMDLCGVTYYQAEGEADKLCAKLVLDNKVYACLSEDNDMFVYGCPRVLKYISLLN